MLEIARRRFSGWDDAEDLLLSLMDHIWAEMTPEERLNWKEQGNDRM